MSRIGAGILNAICRPLPPDVNPWIPPSTAGQVAEFCGRFRRPLVPYLAGPTLEIGAGNGILAAGLRDLGAGSIVVTDYWEKFGEFVRNCRTARRGLTFARADARCLPFPNEAFTAVISQDGFEHFLQPERTFSEIHRVLRPGGWLLVTFGPPWFSPRGGHMMFLHPPPWFHLMFSRHSIFTVRARYRSDGVRNWDEGYSPLSKMTITRFVRLAHRAGLTRVEQTLWPVRRMKLLTYVPLVREFSCNLYAGIWRKPSGRER